MKVTNKINKLKLLVTPEKEVRRSSCNHDKEKKLKVQEKGDVVILNAIDNKQIPSSGNIATLININIPNQLLGRNNFLKKAYMTQLKTYTELTFNIKGLAKPSIVL